MPVLFDTFSCLRSLDARVAKRSYRVAAAALPLLIAVVGLPHDLMGQVLPVPTKLAITDVELGPQGQWAGEIVSAQGIGMSGAAARLSNSRGPVADIVTDTNGRFALANLAPGVHHLHCGGTSHFYRFWKYGTAPPKATHHSLIVAQGNVTRGVQGSRIYEWLADHPGLTYTGIAAAIVVPVVVVGSNSNREPASP